MVKTLCIMIFLIMINGAIEAYEENAEPSKLTTIICTILNLSIVAVFLVIVFRILMGVIKFQLTRKKGWRNTTPIF